MAVPEGYVHKATTHNFNQTAQAVIYYSSQDNLYLIQLEVESHPVQGGRVVRSLGTLTAQQLQLVVDAAGDVLHDIRV